MGLIVTTVWCLQLIDNTLRANLFPFHLSALKQDFIRRSKRMMKQSEKKQKARRTFFWLIFRVEGQIKGRDD